MEKQEPLAPDLKARSARRRKTIQTHKARDFTDAERWDLQFWQARTPEERLSALVAIRRDVRTVETSRGKGP